MARIRTIKPEFWSSEQIVEMSPTARLLFIGLWNFCDDGGNHPASPKTLKMQVFPGDDITAAQVETMIDEMKKAALLIEYEAEGKKYWHVTGWHHQKIEKPNYRHPAPDGQKIADHSPTTRRPLDPVRESNSKGKERKGKEGSESNAPARAHEEIQQPTTNNQQPPDTPLPDQLFATIAAWVETDRGVEILKTWKRDTGYSDRTHGPTTGELRKFIAHHLQKQRDRLITNPIDYFAEQFPGWLSNATQFNRPKNNGNAKPYQRPAPRTNRPGGDTKTLSDLLPAIVNPQSSTVQ